MTKTAKLHYGWIIVATGILVLAIGQGMFSSTNSVFVVPVCEDLGLSRSSFTFHRTIISLVSCCITPFYGKIIQRLGIKKTLLMGTMALSTVTFCYSFCTTVTHFYILAFFNGLFGNALSFMIIGILVSGWFTDSKGLATGLAYSGSGIGGAIMIPAVTFIVERFSWRAGYRVMGILGFVLLMATALLLIYDHPQDKGLEPYTSAGKKAAVSAKPVFDLSLREVLKTTRFWLLAAAFFFIACFASATNTHSTPFLRDLGYSSETVSAVISLFMIFLTVGKILLGFLYDKLGSLVSAIFIGCCSILFPIAALMSTSMPFPWIYAVLIGTASCAFSTPMPILVTRYFGTRDYPTVFSILSTVTALASAIAIPLMGAVYDTTGSYTLGWYVLLILSAAVAFCLITAELIHVRKIKKFAIANFRRTGDPQDLFGSSN